MAVLFKPHPWHGICIGEDAPRKVTAYIEIVPTDTVKYEIEKVTGYLRIDRPQLYSNTCPALYGLIPQTFCAEAVAALGTQNGSQPHLHGDQDPLDICVLTQQSIAHGDILVDAVPIGGLRMIDGGEADDKIVAVLDGDPAYSGWTDIAECPDAILQRLKHYFLTYKQGPDAKARPCAISEVYGREEAYRVIEQSRVDYQRRFSDLASILDGALNPA